MKIKMVLTERNTNLQMHASPGGSSEEASSSSEDDTHSMKVGKAHQAVIPDLISEGPCPLTEPENALMVWAPSPTLSDVALDRYIKDAKDNNGYNVEQALGMLFWHKYDVERAKADLANYTPFPDSWTLEDKVLFDQGFQFHGKFFFKIRQLLPDKSLASIIQYYYMWKKARVRTSLMDSQVRKLSNQKDELSGSEAHSGNESDMDVDKDAKESTEKGNCANCQHFTQLYNTSIAKGSMCYACTQNFKRTGNLKAMRTLARHSLSRSKRKPPRGMHLEQQEFMHLANSCPTDQDSVLHDMDSDIVSHKRQVQNNKQMVGLTKHKVFAGIDEHRCIEERRVVFQNSSRTSNRWTNDELLLAVQGIRKYGRDFKAIAEIVINKTESHIRNFFVNYRRRFNLDQVMKEYDAEHGLTSEDYDEKMETDSVSSMGNNSHPNSPGSSSQTAPPLLHPPHSPSSMPSTSNNQQKLCPPSLQANMTRSNSGRNAPLQPPPLICPTNTFVNGNAKQVGHENI